MKQTTNLQGRKWQITINNPSDYGMSHENIKRQLSTIKSLVYFCMANEIGLDKRTPHTHVYFACDVPIRFSSIKKRFPTAHIERALGTSEENRAYIQKSGKWAEDEKSDTCIAGTFEEAGTLPVERQGERTDLTVLYELIKDGLTNYEILERCPDFMLRLSDIERVRMTIKQEEYKATFRQLEVTYVFGPTETGKTRGVMEENGYEAVYRVTTYDHPFDGYKGEETLVLDEFRGQVKLGYMLNILDGYPLELECRYSNKTACFVRVFLVSNLALQEQYRNVQLDEPASWRAFLRRIHKVKQYFTDGTFREYNLNDYMNGFVEVDKQQVDCPFDTDYYLGKRSQTEMLKGENSNE